jgi:hypothetical protein
MGPQTITTTGSTKGAVSVATQAANAIVIAQQNVNLAKLNSTNQNLKGQLPAINKDYSYGNPIIPYAQLVIASGKFLTNQSYNDELYTQAGMTVTTTAGAWTVRKNENGNLISSDDLLKINAYLTRLQSKVAADKKQIDTINATIKANQTKIDAIVSGKPVPTNQTTHPGGLDNGGGGGGSTKPLPKADNSQTATPQPPPEYPSNDYLWNLPPHLWSIPIDTGVVNSKFNTVKSSQYHADRLGRIWFYNGYAGASAAIDYTTGGQYAGGGGNGATKVSAASINKYGFQFMWNPETYNQSTSVNMQITPSNTDPSIALTGFAAANSQMTFTLRIDRTNDFACASKAFAAILKNNKNVYVGGGRYEDTLPANYLNKFADFYKIGNNDKSYKKDTGEKLYNLMKYGTEADLEYLYRVINGDTWIGIGGRKTANIGYLMPALIRIDLGKQKFVGVVSALSVNHIAFTGDMIPIRSDVNVSVDLRANIQPTTNLTPPVVPATPAKKTTPPKKTK